MKKSMTAAVAVALVGLLTATAKASSGGLPAEGSFLAIESSTTYIGAIKRAEDDDDLVARLVEAAGLADRVTLRPGLGLQVASAAETDLLELDPKPIKASGGAVTLTMAPFQIKTVKLKVSR